MAGKRQVIRATVHSKIVNVLPLAESKQLFGRLAKTKFLEGTVLGVQTLCSNTKTGKQRLLTCIDVDLHLVVEKRKLCTMSLAKLKPPVWPLEPKEMDETIGHPVGGFVEVFNEHWLNYFYL